MTRFVYVDEAGISQNEPIAVVAGVIVHADRHLPLAVGWVNKSQWPTHIDASKLTKKDRLLGPHVTAYMSCVMQVEMWMREKAPPNEVTLVIVEDNTEARSMLREMHNAHRHKQIVRELGPEERRYFPLRKIKQSPLFEQKPDSSPLQIADFCCYVMKRHLMGDAAYDLFATRLVDLYVAHDLRKAS